MDSGEDARVRTVSENLRASKKEYSKTEDDLKSLQQIIGESLQSVVQIIGEVLHSLDNERLIVKVSNGPRYVVGCCSKVDKEKLVAGTRVVLDMTTLTIMRALPREVDPVVYNMLHEDPGNISYSAVGGLSDQIRELRKSIELLLMNPELFFRVEIKPPSANIDDIGISERLLREIFGYLHDHQLKMIMATNLPALLHRPCRLDRKIEIPLPNERSRMGILKIQAAGIAKHGEIDYEAVVKLAEGFNGPDLRNVCTEAEIFTVRAGRDYVIHEDFMKVRVGFKCRSVLVKLRKIYLICIEVPHLKQRLKATNLMSVFDCKIGNGDNQVILAMIERWWSTIHTFCLPCRELGITPKDFTVLTGIGIETEEPMEFDESSIDYGNAIRVFPDMMPTDYEKGCIRFAHLRTYLDHTRVNIRDPANANTIFRAFMLLYFESVLFGNSKSWDQLELLCPITVLENNVYTIDFGSTILGHLYYCLDQASKQEVIYIGGLFQLIEYHCYEYCQI
ncbi:hypothetical protein GIB67_025778 [Kingdonia uniflora]|uniref:Uncharacterized protein n=1 Tax=Kingdonia uniflora TaxID=39325 RepID=A0A7J7NSF2_9MAGN|nr:hypothetical protein GIB67_025778 [Kingdonia uniflora]